ncbi:MAG: hypothetical protein WCG44_00050 [bacterium]
MSEEIQPQPIITPTPVAPIFAPTQPVIPSAVEGSKPSSHLLPIILSSFITIILLVGVYFLFLNKNTQPITATPSPTLNPSVISLASADPTSTWQTYANKDLGFEIMYPPYMKIEKELNDEHNRFTQISGNDLNVQIMLRKSGDIPFDKYYYMDNTIASQSTLGGEKANVYVQDVSKSGCVNSGEGPGCPVSYVSYAAVKGSDIYHLGFYGDAVLSDIEKQILSTLKFTN